MYSDLKVYTLFRIKVMSEDEVKKKYGNLLPKSGVYFLPDDKIISFLK